MSGEMRNRVMGPMFNAASLERVSRDLLSPDRGLLRMYLDEIIRQDTPGQPATQIDRVAMPKTVKVREEVRHFADDQLPALILVAPGTSDQPAADGQGVYRAQFPLAVASIVKKASEELGREIAGILAQAGAACLMQCLPRLDDRISSVTWDGYLNTDTEGDTARTLHVCVHQLTLLVNDVMNTQGLPNFPDTDFAPGDTGIFDPGVYGVVEEVITTTDKIGSDEEDE